MSGAPYRKADNIPYKRKVADMVGVRAYGNEPGVELWLNENGRLVIVAYNEAGHCATQVDLWDILDWVQDGPGSRMVLDCDTHAAGTRSDIA